MAYLKRCRNVFLETCKKYGVKPKNVIRGGILAVIIVYLLFCVVDYSCSNNIYGTYTDNGHSWNLLWKLLG